MLVRNINVPYLYLKRTLKLYESPGILILDSKSGGIIGPPDANLTQEYAPLYERWDMYPIQYEWQKGASIPAASALVEFSYDGVTESFKARQSRIAFKMINEDAWHTVETTINEIDKTLTAALPINDVERIGFAYNTAWYSKFTQRLADEYPVWSHARNSKKSNAQQFLNFFGITLEEVEAWIEWTRRQKYIETADLKQIDYAYVYKIPDEIDLEEDFEVVEIFEGVKLSQIKHVHDFMQNSTYPGYMLDKQERQLFTRVAYGFLDIKQGEDTGSLESTQFVASMEPQMHHIWNTFDEFGLLLDVHRHENESNEDFKERILDVFRYPAGATYLGLVYGIARETNQMKRIIWKDDHKPLYIRVNNKTVLHETIHLDHRPINEYEYIDKDNIRHPLMKVYDNGDFELLPAKTGEVRVVTFVSDIFLFQLYKREKDDREKYQDKIYPILFKESGQATKKLHTWAKEINQLAPIMWGYTQWDVHYWDVVNKENTGLGFIPNQYDGDLKNWKLIKEE